MVLLLGGQQPARRGTRNNWFGCLASQPYLIIHKYLHTLSLNGNIQCNILTMNQTDYTLQTRNFNVNALEHLLSCVMSSESATRERDFSQS